MRAVSGADLRRVVSLLDLASEAQACFGMPFPRPTLDALADLIPAEEVSYFVLRRSGRCAGASVEERDRSVVAYATTGEEEVPRSIAEAMAAFSHQNPVSAVLSGFGPADGPVRQSQVISRRDLERLDYYDAFMRPARVHDVLKVWLHATEGTVACVSFESSSRDFTDGDATLLGILHSHLDALHQTSCGDGSIGLTAEVACTPREAEILTWVARGKRDDEIADLLCISPATVRKHLRNMYEKFGVHSRAEAVARVLSGGRSSLPG